MSLFFHVSKIMDYYERGGHSSKTYSDFFKASPSASKDDNDSKAAASSSSDRSTVEKPCRTCVDFKTWMKQTRHLETLPDDSIPAAPQRSDCPVDKDELGRATWTLLHTTAAHFPDRPSAEEKSEMGHFLRSFSKFYPCPPCAEDLRRDIRDNPPALETRSKLAEWLCQRHNTVNRKLNKPEFDCRLVNERWRDGWKDGSCD